MTDLECYQIIILAKSHLIRCTIDDMAFGFLDISEAITETLTKEMKE